MREHRLLFFSLSFIALFLNPLLSSFSQTRPESGVSPLSEIEQKAIIGRDLIFHRKYEEATQYFKKLALDYPSSLTGSFGQMAIWQAKMFEITIFPMTKNLRSFRAQ
jgi:hypothetical protein